MNTRPRNDPLRSRKLSRRELLKGVVALSTAATFSSCVGGKQTAKAQDRVNAIIRENKSQGTASWQLENTRIDPASKYRCPWIEGYCSRTSVSAGGRINFHVSTNPPSAANLRTAPMTGENLAMAPQRR